MPNDRAVCHEAAHHFWEHCATTAEAAALDRVVECEYLPAVAALPAVSEGMSGRGSVPWAPVWFLVYGSIAETLQADPDELRADILTYYVMPAPAVRSGGAGAGLAGYEEFRRLFRPVIEPLLFSSAPVEPEEIGVVFADGWRELPRLFLANTRRLVCAFLTPAGSSPGHGC
jgi:hypothetical protein